MTGHRPAMQPARPGSRLADSESSDSHLTTSASVWSMCCRRSVASWRPARQLALGADQDLLMGGDFGSVVQRGEVRDATAPERAPDQVVGEMRVLGQQRAV